MKQRFEFVGTPDKLSEHLKWCRQSLGERGRDWDFVGGLKRITIEIKNPRSLTFYTLKYGKNQIS